MAKQTIENKYNISKDLKKKGKKTPKFIFITGGVLSGVGKGVTAAAIGSLLKIHGYSVSNLKCENYLNIDAGTINPIEHGDPFLCEDGLEADMDLGIYERFLGKKMGHKNFTTMGQIYKSVIDRERNMGYKGEDVEHFPHVTAEIIERMKKATEKSDICLVEIGGTAGDYQNAWYFESNRLLKAELGRNNVINIHVPYILFPPHLGEPKTMPTQTSIRFLMSTGVQPDFLVLRSPVDMDERRKYILGMKTSVPAKKIIVAQDCETIYEIPLKLADQELDTEILKALKLKPKKRRYLNDWRKLVSKIKKKKPQKIKITIAGKYFTKNEGDFVLIDAYYALIEALKHASWEQNVELDLNLISTIDIENDGIKSLKDSDGIIVPIGWGKRGVEGKIDTIKFARENKIPYLGLCYGMQLAAVEFARNKAKLKDAHSTEIKKTAENPIIHDIPQNEKYQVIKGDGVSMRLGAYDCILKKNTLAEKIYKKYRQGRLIKSTEKEDIKADGEFLISERHRHRYEFNNDYREVLEEKGLIISGTTPDNFFVEMIELEEKDHPFFIATQGHPEYKSTPLEPHPLFLEFIDAAKKYKNKGELP